LGDEEAEMRVCHGIITRVEVAIVAVIAIVETLVVTVCEAVTKIVTTIVEVTRRVCRWLPWPLNKVCDLVTELVEEVETVTEWICEEVLLRIIRWVEVVVRYVFYVIRWVCWIINWPLRLIEIVSCLLGVSAREHIALCVKVLVDDDGTPALPLSDVLDLLEGTRERFAQCGIELCVASIETLAAPDGIEEFTCDASGFFSRHHLFFERHSCRAAEPAATTMTAFIVPRYEGAKGCAIPRTDYVVIGADASLATLAHELGHHADLIHRDDPSNVMVDGTTDAATEFTRWQCCMLRSARFATTVPPLACAGGPVDIRLTRSRRNEPEPIGIG
jgi:hypothetical protein